MSDLVKRLRNIYPETYAFTETKHIAIEAADEIERKDAAIAELVDILTLIIRGIDGGHIKCAPYFDFDPEATEIVFKSTRDLLSEAIAKYDTPKAES